MSVSDELYLCVSDDDDDDNDDDDDDDEEDDDDDEEDDDDDDDNDDDDEDDCSHLCSWRMCACVCTCVYTGWAKKSGPFLKVHNSCI